MSSRGLPILCAWFYACDSRAVILTLIAFGVLVLCIGVAFATIIRAWRVGSVDRDISAIIRDARNRAHWRGRDSG